jgi:hypothetical protein
MGAVMRARLVIASKQRAPRVDCGGEESAAMEGAAGQLGSVGTHCKATVE